MCQCSKHLICPAALCITFEFMTAADFEARLCPTWLNEIKKTKLYTYTSTAAGINFLLAAVGINLNYLTNPKSCPP